MIKTYFKQMNKIQLFGLLGKQLSYSFSKKYFTSKFEKENITNAKYENFVLNNINLLPEMLESNTNLKGFSVTIPYKEQIIPFLDELSPEAKKIKAINTVKVSIKNNKQYLKGYNTDIYGFENTLIPCLQKQHKKALILGTGGASKAVKYVFEKNNISFCYVSRTKKQDNLTYSELDEKIIQTYQIIINTTPLGISPNIEQAPDIPYKYLNKNHLLYDLVYNPAETKFLYLGRKQNTITINGLRMLELQAEKAWEIFCNS